MKNLLILTIALFNSCATLVNTDFTAINVFTKQDSIKVCVGSDTSNFINSPVRLYVYRSKYPLKLTLKNDTITRNFFIPSQLSGTFLLGNMLNGTFLAGYLIDLSSRRCFTYPKNVLIDFNYFNNIDLNYKPADYHIINEGLTVKPDRKKRILGEKGMVFMKFSIPESNFFHIRNKTGYEDYFGFLGLTAELGYYYTDKNFFSIGAGTLINFLIPFPAPFDYSGVYEAASGHYFDANHGHQLGRFALSYGVNYSKNTFNHNFSRRFMPDSLLIKETDTIPYSIMENAVGLSLNARYMFSNFFQIGIKYLPSLTNINHLSNMNYSHFLFLDFIFNVEFRPGKRHKRINE